MNQEPVLIFGKDEIVLNSDSDVENDIEEDDTIIGLSMGLERSARFSSSSSATVKRRIDDAPSTPIKKSKHTIEDYFAKVGIKAIFQLKN